MAEHWISTEGSSCSSVSYPSMDHWQNVGKAMQSPSQSMLRSSLFWDVMQQRLVVMDILGQPITPIFKGQAVQEKIHDS